MRKAQDKKLAPAQILITTADEKNLALKIAQLNSVIARAAEEKEPSIIADYAYTLAQVFSSFYTAAPIMTAETKELIQSRLALSELTRDILKLLLYLLGIEAPEIMLKKA